MWSQLLHLLAFLSWSNSNKIELCPGQTYEIISEVAFAEKGIVNYSAAIIDEQERLLREDYHYLKMRLIWQIFREETLLMSEMSCSEVICFDIIRCSNSNEPGQLTHLIVIIVDTGALLLLTRWCWTMVEQIIYSNYAETNWDCSAPLILQVLLSLQLLLEP